MQADLRTHLSCPTLVLEPSSSEDKQLLLTVGLTIDEDNEWSEIYTAGAQIICVSFISREIQRGATGVSTVITCCRQNEDMVQNVPLLSRRSESFIIVVLYECDVICIPFSCYLADIKTYKEQEGC